MIYRVILVIVKFILPYWIPEKKDSTLQALNKAKGFLRTELSQRIEIRHTPELRFVYDESIAYGEHMDKILSQVKEEENERKDSSK